MKKLEEYNDYNEMVNDFNNWFGWLISSWDKDRGWIDSDIERDFTDDKMEMMLAITDWQFDDEEFKTLNKLNLIYWYCVRLLYLNDSNNDYFYLEDVFSLLDGIKPY